MVRVSEFAHQNYLRFKAKYLALFEVSEGGSQGEVPHWKERR
jgi:hypothetical protein